MTSRVPEFPRVSATIRDGGGGEVVINGTAHPVTATTVERTRATVLSLVAGKAARSVQRPVRVAVDDPTGQWLLLVHPDGHVDDLSRPDGAEHQTVAFDERTRHDRGRDMSTTAIAAPPETTGPMAPQPGMVLEPEHVDRLPRQIVHQPARLWWVGVHGGAGESTLAEVCTGSRSIGHSWPVPGHAYPAQEPLPVLLVARTHAYGLRRAATAAAEWASGSVDHVRLLGLVLVADAPGRLPKPLRELADRVSGGVPCMWHVPWVPVWRTDPPVLTDLPHSVRGMLAALDELVPADDS